MRRRRKHPLTLLEVVIALSLCGILLTSLFHFLHHMLIANIELEKAKENILSSQCMHARLTQAFAKLSSSKQGNEKEFFYTPDHASTLVFNSLQEIDKDPRFCGELKHMLYLNDHALCLATWSKNKETRNEVLLTHVDALQIEFFNPKKKHWQPFWAKEDGFFPEMVKITITAPQGNKTFTYFL